jgi:hypothetical protein
MIGRCRSVAMLAQMAPQQRLRDGSHIMFINARATQTRKQASFFFLSLSPLHDDNLDGI